MGNHNSGRRKATALKILHGNPGKRRLPVDLRPPAGQVEKPATLSPGATTVWDTLAPLALEMGTLTPADVEAFSRLCELQDLWDEAIKLRGSKAFKLARALQLDRSLNCSEARFGLDPASRSRIHVKQPDEAPRAKWAGVLK